MVPDSTGIYAGLSREVYDEIDRMNFSTLKHFARSPLHALQVMKAGGKDTDALRLGRCVDLRVFEPNRFEAECVVFTGDKRTKEWKAFQEKHAGKEILSEDEYSQCIAIGKAVASHPIAQKYLRGAQTQVSVLWDHVAFDGTVVPCKARFDILGVALGDMKSSIDGSPDAFGRSVWKYGYHVQGAMYLDGLIATGEKGRPVVLLVAEKEPPYAVQVYTVPGHVLERGRAAYRSYLDQLVICQKTGNWPGYGAAELELSLPRWTESLPDGAM